MAEKFSPSQVQTVAQYLTGLIQHVFKPLHLEYFAHVEVLDKLRSFDPDLGKTIDDTLAAVRASSVLQDRLNQQYHAALEKSLQQVFGRSQDEEILGQMRKDLGLVN
jgi:hypothetical protein